MALRGRSLFWTFATAFLAVVVVASLLQVVALYTVFVPVLREVSRADARAAVERVVDELAALEQVDDRTIAGALRQHTVSPERYVLVFERSDGRMVFGRGGGFGRGRGFNGGRPPRGGPGQQRDVELQTLAEKSLDVAGVTVGRVMAQMRQPRLALLPPGMPVRIMIFLPIALIVAASAGLLLLRIVVRRVRRLEDLAVRVAGGDLDARLADPGDDELGRLGHQLNNMTQSLAQARDRILAGEQQRRQLLADVSHELGTPLTSIRGSAETLLNPAVELSGDDRRHYVEGIVEESKRIEMLVHDLFDLTRLEAGAVELQPEPIDVVALCRRTVERFQGLDIAAQTKLSFSSEMDAAVTQADGRRMEQVLDNVIVNALRHAPDAGAIAVDLRSKTDAAGEAIEIRVADNGPGFAESDLPYVFDRFYRGDESRATEGTGLGLAIVQEIVRRHGGAVRAGNASAGGAEILITLPFKTA